MVEIGKEWWYKVWGKNTLVHLLHLKKFVLLH
jgi:hypothetical protein